MRTINVTKAAKRNAKSETVSFAEIGAALIAAATPATAAKPDSKAAQRDAETVFRNALRGICRTVYNGPSLTVHGSAKKHPVSFYIGRISGTDTTGHHTDTETARTASLILPAFLARDANNTVCLSALYADKSVATFLADLRILRAAPDATRATFTDHGITRGKALLAKHRAELLAAGYIDANDALQHVPAN